MPSGWDVYYVVFLSAFLALGIPITLSLVSFALLPKRPRRKALGPQPTSEQSPNKTAHLNKKTNARFFLAANAALVLITLMLVLVPCAGILKDSPDTSSMLRGLLCIISIAGFAALGLLYSARKGDLSWLKSYQPSTSDKTKAES